MFFGMHDLPVLSLPCPRGVPLFASTETQFTNFGGSGKCSVLHPLSTCPLLGDGSVQVLGQGWGRHREQPAATPMNGCPGGDRM